MSLRSHEAAACAVIAIGVCGVLVGSLLVESMRNGQSSAKATVSTAQSTEEVQAQTEPTQTPAPTPEPEPVVQTVHFSATGDNLIHEGIYNQARARGSDGHYDFIPAYENLRDFYAGFDVNWLNQETLVNDDYEPSGYPMFSTPGDITNALYNVGFRVFSLSNNHSYDKGAGGIASSMAHWAAMPDDVVSMGFYNLETYDDYVYQTVNGVTIGYLSYTEMTNGLPTPSGSEYGVVYLDQRDVIEKQITDMRPNCDVLVVSCHWGVEGSHTVTDVQRETAQWLADQGADLIIGTHPHVTQTAQWQVVLLFLLLCFGRFVPQPGSDQKSDGNAGQKTERIHADILNHSGAARDKELVEFISARIGGTGHSADQCFLHKLFGPARFACAAKQMDGDGGADTESTVNINMCPLANVGIVVLAAEPLGGQAVSRGGFHFFRYLLAEGRGALPRLGGKQKDCRHDGQCNAQHHRAHKFQLIVLLRHSRTSAFHRAIMYNTHGILEKHTSFAVQNQAKKRHIRMDCTMLYLFYLSL